MAGRTWSAKYVGTLSCCEKKKKLQTFHTNTKTYRLKNKRDTSQFEAWRKAKTKKGERNGEKANAQS